jgi:hemolysin activation/secretion protein
MSYDRGSGNLITWFGLKIFYMQRIHILLPLGLALPALALAQPVRPSGGQLLNEITPVSSLPSAPLSSDIATAPAPEAAPIDTTPIPVKQIVITGNTVIPTAELHALVASVEGTTVTLNELRSQAERLTQAYVARGYLLARGYLPAQEINADGVVTLAVQEGRLGEVKLSNTSRVADPVARRFLAPLAGGAVVESAQVEDALMRLNEVPGVEVASTLQPGVTPGTADLLVNTMPTKRVSGSVNLDNSGGDSTGAIRLGANAEIASPFGRGDRLSLQSLSTLPANENLRYGRVAYDYALGGDGLRVGTAYSHLIYALGQNFANLDAHGTADVAQLWISRPLLRSRDATVDVRLGYDYRHLVDQVDFSSTNNARNLHSAIAEVSGGRRDRLFKGGYTSARLTTTFTQVDITDADALANDSLGTQGGAAKLEVQVQRQQVLPAGFLLDVKASGQVASDNLDSADQLGAAGPSGVRAFPQGELYGDQGVLFTTELSHALPVPQQFGTWQEAVFYDQATIWTSTNPSASNTDNERTLAGLGVGLRWNYRKQWSARMDAAWRTMGGSPAAAGAHNPQIWASLGYAF